MKREYLSLVENGCFHFLLFYLTFQLFVVYREALANENPEEGQEDGGMLNDVTARVRTLMESVRDLMASITHGSDDANESEGDETDTA